MANSEYSKLPGRGYSLGSYSHLWLGKDHILLVDSNTFSESYKRFDFRDIRAITITNSRRRLLLNVIFGVFAAVCLLPLLFSSSTAAVIGWSLLASPFLILILVNSLKGPACTCHINTAVQREKLRPLSRVKRADRVLEKLTPLILAAQEDTAPRPEAVSPENF